MGFITTANSLEGEGRNPAGFVLAKNKADSVSDAAELANGHPVAWMIRKKRLPPQAVSIFANRQLRMRELVKGSSVTGTTINRLVHRMADVLVFAPQNPMQELQTGALEKTRAHLQRASGRSCRS